MIKNSYLYNATFLDDLYETYLLNPSEVNEYWRDYFMQLQQEEPLSPPDTPHTSIINSFVHSNPLFQTRKAGFSPPGVDNNAQLAIFARKQAAVLQLINAYRFRGHQQAKLDPLQLQERPFVKELDPGHYGLTTADMSTIFDTGPLFGVEKERLADIIQRLKKIYCGTIGAEYMYITDTQQKRWFQERLEGSLGHPNLMSDVKINLLERLTAAQGLEEFLQTKYVGQKRFSLEGGESLIPLLDELIQYAGAACIKEFIIGMAHRGRLNVLVNILGKRPKDLFSEFEGTIAPKTGSGDVKYHLGFSSDMMTPGGTVHLAMAFNPSHLEIINPVVEGAVRARQQRRGDKSRNEVLPILIHGDAAFAGQGVVMETLNLSQTHGYGTGGTIHIIINNQIGFTTSDPLDSRSSLYCSDVAKMIQAPIFHINADDPESVLFITQLLFEYRMTFHKDVIIDLVCYRRQGHNEADEPFVTQPIMYQKIANHPTTRAIYAQKLVTEEIIAPEEGEILLQQYRAALKTKEFVSRPITQDFKHGINWKPYIETHWSTPVETQISQEKLQHLISQLTKIPADFELHRAVARMIEGRQRMGQGEIPLDWGCAETLAYASLLVAGYPVRLSGQDSARGTFAHRHAVLHDQKTGETYFPLRHLSETQAQFIVINSLLSEAAVLGFEYGYSASDPDTLVLWEAQFGDFANNAQVVIDQFISSSELKWQRYSGLVMLLPHGYDGQGPEHSSARLERFLQLCAEDNIQVCVPTTPAQFFHLLRRQMLRPYRKPLIVMTPKSLLRHKLSVSAISEFTDQGFQTVIDETEALAPAEKIKRLLFCTGKVYFDLLEARQRHGIEHIAIIRLEQLYPYPKEAVSKVLERYPDVIQRVWVQEEPRNQGAWWYMRAHMDVNLSHRERRIEYAGRPSSASPATGYLSIHRQQLQQFIADALELNKE
jgi:2-oxoglutarate dehydrogenase E1 component